MNIQKKAIVSNSEMIKFYKLCRDKAECYGKIFVFKNNQLDAVLFSIAEYERLSPFLEYLETLSDVDFETAISSLPHEAMGKTCGVEVKKFIKLVLPVPVEQRKCNYNVSKCEKEHAVYGTKNPIVRRSKFRTGTKS